MALSFIDLDNDYLIAFEEALSVRDILVYIAFSMNACRNMDINKSKYK